MPDQSLKTDSNQGNCRHKLVASGKSRAFIVFAVAAVFGLTAGGLLSAAASGDNKAFGLPVGMQSASMNDILALTGRLDDQAYGLYIIDTNTRNVAVYEYVKSSSGRQLHLRAARNFAHDLKLSQYNTSPSPDEIAELVSQDTSAR